jgi:hypothetical protein
MLTHAIYTWRGEPILITEKQASACARQYLSGADALAVAGQVIPRGNIARIGTHENTADMMRVAEQDWIRSLPAAHQTSYRRRQMETAMISARAATVKRLTVSRDNALPDGDTMMISSGMTPTEEERGDAAFYIDATGQKMYS